MKTQFVINEKEIDCQKGLIFLREGDNVMYKGKLYRVDTFIYHFDKKLMLVYLTDVL